MKKVGKHIAVLFLTLILASCYQEEVVFNSSPNESLQLPLFLNFNEKDCAFDAKNNMIRYCISESEMEKFSPFTEFQQNASVQFEDIVLKNNHLNELGKIELKKSYNISFIIDGESYDFQLIFTNLPIIQIICDSEITDEPKTLSRIQIIEQERSPFTDFAGIEYRGKFSRSFPKKSFGFSLWENGLSNDEYATSLLQLGNNIDWILNSSIIDPARIRNTVSFELWSMMENETTTASNHFFIVSKPVELFYNNDFRGLYFFSENMNHFLLQASKSAVLYKGVDWANEAPRFECYNPELSSNQFWNGWEQKFPDRKEQINWEPLHRFYQLAVDASDKEFKKQIESQIDVSLLIDYFLLLNLTYAGDNTGKNIFLFKNTNNDKFQIIPWDLDGSWGIKFDGTRVPHDNILTNNLFERLYETNPNNYRMQMKNRWMELRAGVFSETFIQQVFEAYFALLRSSDIIKMENQQWNIALDINEEQEYIKSWSALRLQFLDEYFSSF